MLVMFGNFTAIKMTSNVEFFLSELGLVEQGNCDIEKKISALRAERKCKSWVKLLPEIQCKFPFTTNI